MRKIYTIFQNVNLSGEFRAIISFWNKTAAEYLAEKLGDEYFCTETWCIVDDGVDE